jgi:RHS repeat-associated protein
MLKYWALVVASAVPGNGFVRKHFVRAPGKLLAGGILLLVMLLFSGSVLAIAKGPDGGCPHGTSPDQSNPGNCLDDPNTLGAVHAYGTYISPWGWQSPWTSLSGYYTPIDLTSALSQHRVAAKPGQKLQGSPCDEKEGEKGGKPEIGATGRPVLIATGTKVQPEGDIPPTGDGVALEMGRLYSSGNTKIGAFGQAWASSIDYTLVFEYANLTCWAYLDRIEPCSPNGQTLLKIHAYSPSGYATHFSLVDGVWTSDDDDVAQLINGEWVVDYADASRHFYTANGQPEAILDERGIGLTYTYNASNQLTTITHSSGRHFTVTWSNHKIASVTAPNNKIYSYSYNAKGYLASVTYPENLGTRSYHYEDSMDASRLTGISVNGLRYSRYQYLADGKVQWSGLEGGIERSTFAYGTDFTDVTNALGQTTHYDIGLVDGHRKILAVTRPPSPTCSGAVTETFYDADGNVDRELDAYSVQSTYTYDGDQRPIQIIKGIGPNDEADQQQITQYVWDSVHKGRLNQIKVFGNSTTTQPYNTTTYTYYPDGDARARLLQSVAVTNNGAGPVGTLTTTYNYTLHPNGLIATMTVDGPLPGNGDSVVSAFDTAGNLLTVKNSLGHTTTYANYNALGQPGKITSPNGAVTAYTYNARGQVLTERRTVDGTFQTTRTAYDDRGRVASVTTPDGVVTRHAYDQFDRLVGISRDEPYSPDGSEGVSGWGGGFAWTGYEPAARAPDPECELDPSLCERDPPTIPPPSPKVKGYIDGITSDDGAVTGWACATTIDAPIEVHMYVDGPAGVGTFVMARTANLSSEAAISTACNASGTHYRFSIPLSESLRQQYGYKTIYIHGISPTGGDDLAISGSGTFRVPGLYSPPPCKPTECEPEPEPDPPPPPPAPAPQVKGYIDGVTSDNGAVTGWACATTLDDSIDVHMYVGGAAGVGTLAWAGTANQSSGADVASACEAGGSHYRFSIPLTTALRQQFSRKTIYIHGISPVGGSNAQIDRSGLFRVPALPPPPTSFQRYTYNFLGQLTLIQTGIEYTADAASTAMLQQSSGAESMSAETTLRACDPDCPPRDPDPDPSPSRVTVIQHAVYIDYDAGGFVSKRRGNHGQSITYHYNANGDVDWMQDALGNRTAYGYDRLRRVVSVRDPMNGVTTMAYNAIGQVKTVQDARGNTTTYTHDGLGNLLTQSSPDTGMTGFTYNAAGQRIEMQRADLSVTDYTYDALGRLKTTSSGGQTRTLTYDSCTGGKGLLCSAAGTGGAATTSTNFAYTPWGQVATRKDVLDGTTDTTTYSYDGMLRLAGIGYPSGVSVAYGYADGNLATIDATVNGATERIATIGGYQFLGPATRVTYGNGLVRQTNYDTDGRITGISTKYSTPIQSLTYGFDAADRITGITNGVEANLSQTFGYDALSRVTAAANPGGNAATFGYDAVGNRITRTDTAPASNTTYLYAGTSNRLQQVAQGTALQTYTTNAVGDTTAFTDAGGAMHTLAYDPFGRLASHTKAGMTTSYTVNALDQRVAKTGTGVIDTTYVYAGQNQLLAERTASGWTSYLWNGSEPVAMVRGTQIYYVHSDHLNRPEKVTNSARTIVWRANNFGFNRSVALDAIGGLNLGFPGQYWDAESGLWHNGYRDYDYTTGRYLQSDPIGLGGGANTFLYAAANPISVTDPTGLIAYVCKQGNNVGISLPIKFSGGTKEDQERIVNAIQSEWTGSFGGFNVKLTVRTYDNWSNAINMVYVNQGRGPLEDRARASSNSAVMWSTSSWANDMDYPHEAGHLMGLPDTTLYPGSIMDSNLSGATPQGHEIQAILESAVNQIGCGCSK